MEENKILKNNSIPLKIFILRLFFFPNILQQKYDTDEERANQVIENLITPNNPKNQQS